MVGHMMTQVPWLVAVQVQTTRQAPHGLTRLFLPVARPFTGREPAPRPAAGVWTGGGVHKAPRADQLRSLRACAGYGKLGTERFYGRPAPPRRFLMRYRMTSRREETTVEVSGLFVMAYPAGWCGFAWTAAGARM